MIETNAKTFNGNESEMGTAAALTTRMAMGAIHLVQNNPQLRMGIEMFIKPTIGTYMLHTLY
jgi:hypothetical protein